MLTDRTGGLQILPFDPASTDLVILASGLCRRPPVQKRPAWAMLRSHPTRRMRSTRWSWRTVTGRTSAWCPSSRRSHPWFSPRRPLALRHGDTLRSGALAPGRRPAAPRRWRLDAPIDAAGLGERLLLAVPFRMGPDPGGAAWFRRSRISPPMRGVSVSAAAHDTDELDELAFLHHVRFDDPVA